MDYGLLAVVMHRIEMIMRFYMNLCVFKVNDQMGWEYQRRDVVAIVEYFERKFRFTHVEVWDVRVKGQIYRLVLKDEKRKTTFDDLRYPPNFKKDPDDLRDNFVKVDVYSEKLILEATIKTCLSEFAEQCTDHIALAHCNIVVEFYVFPNLDEVELLLNERYGIDINAIPLRRLQHLNQGDY